MEEKSFSFCYSTQLDIPVYLRVASLEGQSKQLPYSQLHANPELKYVGSNTNSVSELYATVQLFAESKPLTVPIRTSYKPFKIRRLWNEWITLPIKYSDLPRTSVLAVTLWDYSADIQHVPFGGATLPLFEDDGTLRKGRQKLKIHLGKEADGSAYTSTPHTPDASDELDRLEKLIKMQDAAEIPQIGWMDALAFQHLERLNRANTKDNVRHLYLEFPIFDFPIVHHSYTYPSITDSMPAPVPLPYQNQMTAKDDRRFVTVFDPEMMRENPIEVKHRRLTRSHRNGPMDRDMKPDAKTRDELNEIIKLPSSQELSGDEKDLLWKFRYFLTRDKRALTKFVKSVTWSDSTEARQAAELLPRWSSIDVDDALELLGPSFTNVAVRSYAVQRLQKSDDEEILLYLLQLVQALKFENIPVDAKDKDGKGEQASSLADFLVGRAVENEILGIHFHWYLMVECEDRSKGRLFAKVAHQFMTTLVKRPDGKERRSVLKRQAGLVADLAQLSQSLRSSKDGRPKKIEKLRHYLADPKHGMAQFEPLPLPLNPSLSIVGIVPDTATIFKSSMLPLRLDFKCDDGSTYPVIFKTGDDLRQDQLVVQIIRLMDRLLLKENLDLKLTPYRVLATGPTHGAMQFVPSMPIATALVEFNGSVLAYMKKNNPDPGARFGVKAEAMDTYVKSCAGYCVITYLLGVGDRHLDNLLISPDGHFFHIDFGFILGRDPKPFPPAMKLCKEMVEGMGGAQSEYYKQFKSYCYTAFTTLRKQANLILNLFALMVDANIPDIKIEPDKAVTKVKDKFCLEMSEEEAINFFETLINDSVNALFPQVIDRLHTMTQYWRS
ncbi:phosphatidylinositol 3-kinase [Saitoella complicata NRRL Y-17804]|uniref:phosphatidylinositol 3-kinase n=1 Tax=Saitoella complicata (strain BCRC 22490 / CBS 7301 / JCM 7358 / NBRC 10748 / NRRL Y-17804) TaxID=698492 RepID=UPI000867B6A7|nr:phosphatidylinositol 3-kinase [Saitoella complicata NRRL Y-17804]ODQ54993.1 phosphatidylinositol 3-kinase [Saitoella complicata NRRL Y-17804]